MLDLFLLITLPDQPRGKPWYWQAAHSESRKYPEVREHGQGMSNGP